MKTPKIILTRLLSTAILCLAVAISAVAQTQVIAGSKIPRLTTGQRDIILLNLTDSIAANGQLIYNEDIDCLEYWNGETKEWISLCHGTTNPAVDIPLESCNKIRVYGKYYVDSPLDNSHYIIVPVTVTKKGDYNIVAITGNGYYFQASGTFQETGTYNVRLEGMGMPGIQRRDEVTFTCNGQIIGSLCNITIDIEAHAMGYQTVCEDITVHGTYQTRTFMGPDNYVKIPVDVLNPGGVGANITSIQTDVQNGISFSLRTGLEVYGADTLILKASGSPKQEGTFRFTFTTDGSIQTTCSFTVDCFSLLGTFDEPACNCLAIYAERPFIPNGEYWLQDCVTDSESSSATRTFCDIKGGGWTLVWSYSENTARNVYGNSTSMAVPGNTYGNSINTPRNRITSSVAGDEDPLLYRIDYNDFRLNRTEWENLGTGNTTQMKVHITDDPVDMENDWALNNYAIISPRNIAENPLFSTFNNRAGVPTVGKIYGKNWRVIAGGTQGWDEVTGGGNNSRTLRLYSSALWCTHWDFFNSGSSTLFEVYPNRGGADNQIRMTDIDNSFGDFSQPMANHHFGKCGSTGDDYSFSTKTCPSANLYPHSMRDGEGRVLQWFIR